MGRGRDAYKGIGGAHARANRLTIGIRLKAIAQEASIALVDFVKAGDGRSGIGEGFRREALAGSRCLVQGACSRRDTPDDARIGADDSDLSNIQPLDLKIETRLVDRLIQ